MNEELLKTAREIGNRLTRIAYALENIHQDIEAQNHILEGQEPQE